jgi:catechol 2,3-dioxygenase-like lactoylglutathione lyase family enzyme
MRFAPDHVGIVVSDVERSKAFYRALGFELDAEYDDGTKTLVFLKGPGLRLELFCYRETPPVSSAAGQRVLGFRHLAFRVDDIDEAVAQLIDAGILPPDTVAREVPDLARLVFLSDPDGVEIEVMQDLTPR